MGLFTSKEEKEKQKELEKNIFTLLTKFEIPDLQKFCLNTMGEDLEPWRKKGDEYEKNGKIYQDYYPIERNEYQDFIWKNTKQNKITLAQIQDFAVRHSLVPRYYFDDEKPKPNTRRGFSDSVKREVLKRQDYNCKICGSLLTSPDFDHIDRDNSNNSIGNCQALCPSCHRKKTGEENAKP